MAWFRQRQPLTALGKNYVNKSETGALTTNAPRDAVQYIHDILLIASTRSPRLDVCIQFDTLNKPFFEDYYREHVGETFPDNRVNREVKKPATEANAGQVRRPRRPA